MTDELPPGWAMAPLGALGNWFGGGTPSKAVSAYWENGTVHWVSPKDMKRPLIDYAQDQISERAVQESATNLVPANSVLMVTRSGILEHSFPVAVNTVPVTMNQDLKAVAVRGVDPVYTRYFLQSHAQNILRTCKKDGTTVSSIDTDRLAAYGVNIAPAAEQKRIVSKIDELFSRIDEGERALERVSLLVERYRQSVLKAAVTGELTRAWREKNKDSLESGKALLARILTARRTAWEQAELEKMKAKGITPTNDKWKQKYTEPTPPNTTALPRLPDGWAWVTLPMLCSENSTNGISVQGSSSPPGTPALRLDAMLDSGFNYSARRYIPITEDQAQRLAICEGDFFVSRANGSLHLVGRAVLASSPPEQIVFPDTMIRYRPLAHPDVRPWLAAVWPSRLVRDQLERRAKTTAGIYKVSQGDLSEIALPLPPLSEQAVAVSGTAELMSRMAKLEGDLHYTSRKSSALRQATLKSAFTGRLVPQDLTDEPASALLERITAERGKENAAPKRGREKKTTA